MLSKSWKLSALALVYSCAFVCANAGADTPLLDEVHTVAASTVAIPVEHSFTISASGTYQVSLVDLGAALTPTAPLASVKLAITSGSTLTSLTPTGGTAATEMTAAGSAQFSASAGTYIVHVIGMPGTGTVGSGPIGITITNTADSSQVAAYSDTLALPSTGTASNNEAVLDDSFSVSTAGTYQVTLTDLQLPQSLSLLTLVIAQQGGSLVMITPPGGSPMTSLTVSPPGTSASGSVSLTAGVTYRIFAVGQQTGSPTAGLYGVNVTGSGQPAYSKTIPLGLVTLLGNPTVTAGTATLTLTDLQFPGGSANALANIGAAVTLNGQSVITPLATSGSTTFTAAATTYQVFGLGVPSASTTGNYQGTGSYSVSLKSPDGSMPLSVARAVSASGGGFSAYSYDTTTVSGETYALDLADFATPKQFTAITAAAVQAGAVLGTSLQAAGTQSITPVAGPVSLLVFAQGTTSGGLFGIDLTAQGAGSPAFETTQGVGQLFTTYKVPITTGGNYNVTAADVGFPAKFSTFAVVVTRGTSLLGSIYGSGTFTFAATGGDYFVNFVAQPTGSDQAGTYAMTLGPAPAAPSVTIQASAPSVASGATVQLQWSSQNATSCTASGGWSGSQALSGTATSAALTSAATFTLTCVGAGGSTTQSVTVNISSPSTSSHGGGAIRPDLLAFLLGVLLVTRLFPIRRTHQ